MYEQQDILEPSPQRPVGIQGNSAQLPGFEREQRVQSLVQNFEQVGLHPELFDHNSVEIQYIQRGLKDRILIASSPKAA